MTREEIIEAIQNDNMMPFLQDWEARDVVDFVLKNSRPYLPAELYEAAEDRVTENGRFELTASEKMRIDDIMFGAEWMARHGWISVDERLPEMDEEVIVLTDELGTAPIYKIAFGHIVDVKRCIDYNGWNCSGVKYLMPCPKIPIE